MIPLLGSADWDRDLEDDVEPSIYPCPRCHQAMGDGDRVSFGECGRCRHRRRQR